MQQNFSTIYYAGFSVPTDGKFAPVNDGTTSFLQAVTVVDPTAFLAVKGFQQITSLSAATALTVPSGSTYALVQATGQNVRWRNDGTNPTATVGMLLAAGATGTFYGAAQLAALKFIEATASAVLNVSYYGPA